MEQSLRSMQYPLIVTDRPVNARHRKKKLCSAVAVRHNQRTI